MVGAAMHGFYSEHRTLAAGISLSRDLAQHIYMRGARSGVVVVAEKPIDVLSTTTKQWRALIRQVERERASTLKLSRIAELTNQINWMQRLRFTTKLEEGILENSVTFATLEELVSRPPICSTLYVTQKLGPKDYHMITSWLPKGSVVIIYER